MFTVYVYEQNSKTDFTYGQYDKGDYKIVYNANEGYYFDESQPQIKTGNAYTVDFNEDRTIATITITIDRETELGCYGTKITETSVTMNLINCTSDYTKNKVTINDDLRMTITANEGYKFYKAGTINNFGQTTRLNPSKDGKTIRVYEHVYDYQPITINAEADKIIEDNNYPFTNLYVVTPEILSKLSNVVYIGDGGSSSINATYMQSLIEVPFDIKGDKKVDVILGNKSITTVQADYISNPLITINLGTITVPEKYNNVYDYMNTEAIIHLPFAETTSLDINYVIAHTIKIDYVIDLYSGDGTVNLYSDLIDDVFKSFTTNLASNIPFVTSANNSSVYKDLKQLIRNGLYTPYIEIKRNKPYNNVNDSVFGKSVKMYGRVGEFKGFTQFENVELKTSASEREDAEITSLLKTGVFI